VGAVEVAAVRIAGFTILQRKSFVLMQKKTEQTRKGRNQERKKG
jgi:hypothetical protein